MRKSIGSTRFYLLTNPRNQQATATVDFTEQAAPEIWDPFTGDIQKAAFARSGGHVQVEVKLAASGSELLGFNDARMGLPSLASVEWTEMKSQAVGEAGWTVDLLGLSEKGVGIRIHEEMPKLIDWIDDPALISFSGAADYVTHVSVSADDLKSAEKIVLDLGSVKDAAKVKINGSPAATLVVQPFAIDIKSLLHPGDNELDITVSNSLNNYVSSLKGAEVSMFQSGHFPPLSSGLLGPVAIRYETRDTSVRSIYSNSH